MAVAAIPTQEVVAGGWTFTVYLHQRRPGARGEVLHQPVLTSHRQLRCGTIPPALRWWFDVGHVATVMAALRADRVARQLGLADLIEFITATGLSLEESLSLTWPDVRGSGQTGLVVAALGHGELPLSEMAAAVLERRRGLHALWVFRVAWREIAETWRRVRGSMGLVDATAADLRALRRKAGRRRTGHVVPAADIVERLEREGIAATHGHVRLLCKAGRQGSRCRKQ